MSEVFPEQWVRDLLSKVLPEGVVEHRFPEVMKSLRALSVITRKQAEEAFFEPLRIYGVRFGTPGHHAIRSELAARFDALVMHGGTAVIDDRPLVSEWIAMRSINWKSSSKTYWKQLFELANRDSRMPNEVGGLLRSIDRHREAWRLPMMVLDLAQVTTPADWVRRLRYIERGILRKNFPAIVEFDPVRSYGSRIGAAIAWEIDRMTQDLDCVDNVRVAELSDKTEMSHYRYQKRRGCCGSVDRIVTVSGRTFTIGCNYGH